MPFTSIKVGGPASIRLAQRLGLKGKGAIAARLRYAQQFGLEAVAVGAEDEPTMAGLSQQYGDKVRVVWKHEPLPFHPRASIASWAAGSARAEGRQGVLGRARQALRVRTKARGR